MKKITKKEIGELVRLLNKIPNPEKGLPQEVFDALCRIVPFSSCELVILNKKGEILLTFREDQWWKGWHVPGGILRMNEDYKTRLSKVAQNELGTKLSSFRYLFPMNYTKTSRGHDVAMVFLCTLSGRPKLGKFFKILPKDMVGLHKNLYKRLQEMKLV